jgi:hypothetical protein
LVGGVFLPLLLVFFVLFGSHGVAQSSDPEPAESSQLSGQLDSLGMASKREFVPTWYDMFANIPRDWSRYYKITIVPDKIPAALAITGLTAALIYSDHDSYQASSQWYHSSGFVKSASDFFEYLGDGKPQFGLAAAFGAYGFIARDHRALRVASQTVQVILACGTVVQLLKHITGRESPFVSTSPRGVWRFFPNQIEYHKHVPQYDAFPSGHIATALATLTVVSENYPEERWMKPVGYVVVGLIGVSMANTGIHWYSDYPLGLALGYSFGMLAAHPEGWNAAKAEDGNSVKLTMMPMISPARTGIGIALSF